MAGITLDDLNKQEQFPSLEQNQDISYNPSIDPPRVPQEDPNDPGVFGGIAAGFKKESVLYNFRDFLSRDKEIKDPNFNPFSNLDVENLNTEDIKHFLYADSEEEVQAIRDRLNKEKQLNDQVARSGAWGMLGIFGGAIADPTILIPATWGVKAARVAKGVTTLSKIQAISKGAATGSALTGSAIGIQESILSQAQLTRTARESWNNIVFGSVLGGVVGTGIGFMAAKQRAAAEQILKTIDNDVKPKVDPETGKADYSPKNAGAAETPLEIRFEEYKSERARQGIAYLDFRTTEKIINNTDNEALKAKLMKKQHYQEQVFKNISSPLEVFRSPVIRAGTSSFTTVRRVGNEFFETPFTKGYELEGVATRSIETELAQAQADLSKLQREMRSSYFEYTGISDKLGKGATAEIVSRLKSLGREGGIMSYGKFKEEIARTIRSGEKHPIDQVNKASDRLNKHYINLAKQLKSVGRLTEFDDKLLGRYLTRIYNKEEILKDLEGFKEILRKHYAAGKINPKWQELKMQGKPTKDVKKWLIEPEKDLGRLGTRVNNSVAKILNRNFDVAPLADEAEDVVRTVRKKSPVTEGAAFLRHRDIDIPDLELGKFIHSDVDAITGIYTHRATAIIEFEKMLQRNGWTSLDDIKRSIGDDFDLVKTAEVNALKNKFTKKHGGKLTAKQEAKLQKQVEKKKKSLEKEFRRSIELVDDMADIIMGNINKNRNTASGRFLQYLRKYNVLMNLGGVIISSLPDTMMSVFKHGFARTVLDGYMPMLKNFKAFRASSEELKDFGVGIELEMNRILRMLHEGDFRTGVRDSKFVRFGDDMVQFFGRASGLSYWNTLHKRIGAHVSGSRTIRYATKLANGKEVPRKEIARLANLGIDKDIAVRISKEYKKYGGNKDGSFIANFENWEDLEAAKALGRAIAKETDETILTPGLGDIPIPIQKSEVLKTIFQYKSFSATATNRLLLAGLQRKNMQAALGFISLIHMGMLVYITKEGLRGREANLDYDKLLAEGLSRSGVLGLMGDYVMALNPYASSSRYLAFRGDTLFLGPSSGVPYDAWRAFIKGPSDGELSDTDVRKMTRLLPFQNLFYLQLMFGKADKKEKRRRF